MYNEVNKTKRFGNTRKAKMLNVPYESDEEHVIKLV